MRFRLTSLATLFLLAACTPPANYAPDALLFGPNEPIRRGTAAASQMFTDMFGSATFKDVSLKTDDFLVSGDLAIQSGTYAWTVAPKKGKETKDNGKYVSVWQKQADGSWKMIRDIFNTDVPLPAAK